MQPLRTLGFLLELTFSDSVAMLVGQGRRSARIPTSNALVQGFRMSASEILLEEVE